MFKSGQPNPYDEIVVKTTDENLTSENWEMILNLCDKVVEEREQGARNVVAAILRRLTHRTSNVQLYTLTLAESLTKNCGIDLHREIASRAFTQGLEKLITDRNTHEKVRRRALSLIAEWTSDFEKDPSLGIMEECYDNLKSKGYKFETPNEPPPPEVDDDIRRREEEELQRVLEMSMQDKGGRGQWSEYSLASSNGASSSAAAAAGSSSRPAATSSSAAASSPTGSRPTYGGYVPSASPAVSANDAPVSTPTRSYSTNTNVAASPAPSIKSQDSASIVTRVRALHTFEPTEAGELAFEKGDIIKVVDRGYKDWWRGQLKGRTGIFPVNYVEPLPEPTAADIAREAEQEAAVFNQAANVDRLLQLLRQMDPVKDNLADNEEIQEMYRSCMSLRPKIVKLIDKYSQKRADLVTMNETFIKARTIFDRMMEESLARHTSAGGYDQGYGQQPYPRPDSRVNAFGWNPAVYEQPAYGAYPAPAGPYPGPEHGYPGGPPPAAPYVDPAYQQPVQPGPYPPQPYGAPAPQAGYVAPPPQSQGYPGGPAPQQPPPHVEAVQQQQQQQPQTAPIPAQAQSILQQQQQPAHAPVQTQPQVQQPQQVLPQALPQQQTSPQPQTQPQVAAAQSQPQAQAQPQLETQQQQPASQLLSGPPYVYDPNATYPDPNVQAWAQYYAQGGTDPTGSVYFISIPGVKEGPPPTQTSPDVSAAQTPIGGGTAPLNVQHTTQPAGATPGSPGSQHAQAPQSFYQAHPAEPNASNASLSSAPGQTVPYGASPYAAATSPGAEPPAWQAQYGGLPGQFAGMNVSGDGQAGHAGVGAST